MVAGDGVSVEQAENGRAGDGDVGRGVESQRGTGDGDFKRGCAFGIADVRVGDAERERVEWAGRWHSHFPIADAPGKILHGRHGASGEHVDGVGLVCVSGHVAHGDAAIDEGLPAADAAQVTEVGFKT